MYFFKLTCNLSSHHFTLPHSLSEYILQDEESEDSGSHTLSDPAEVSSKRSETFMFLILSQFKAVAPTGLLCALYT